MKKLMKKLQSNNSGFSLLEVLIAMIILAIACVPLLRAFGTSAQTNAKAKIQMKATTAAENLMESIKKLDNEGLEQLIVNYSDSANVNDAVVSDETDASGKTIGRKIVLTVNDNAEMNGDLPDGYSAVVTMEASGTTGDEAYPNANGLNLSDFEPISVRDCAIYTMDSDFDDAAYEVFKQRNEKYAMKFATGVITVHDLDYFKKNLKRDMIITVEKVGTYLDDDGEEQPTIRVKLNIKYTLKEGNVVEDKEYEATSAYLFDNTSSHKALNGIYLFYYPRYVAAEQHLGQKYENIVVYNTYNINTNVYITAINGAADYNTKHTSYIDDARCNITVNEGAPDANGKGYITLRTNLLDVNSVTNLRTPYSKGDSNTYKLGFKCTYNSDGSSVTDTADVVKMLTISDIDGKTFSTDDTPIRIYRIRVEIKDPDGNVITEMDGTKLKQN